MAYIKYNGLEAMQTGASVSGLYGTDGPETLYGSAAFEELWGSAGDVLVGGGGDDSYFLKSTDLRIVETAGGGVDTVVSWGNVYLPDYQFIENLDVRGDKTYGAGDAGDNIVKGGAGSQQLYGGFGQDVLIGGSGADTFIVIKGEGNDVVQDFNPAQDTLRLSSGYTSFDQVRAHMTQRGADVHIDLGGADGLLLRDLKVHQLGADDFQLMLDPARLGAVTFQDEFNGPLSLWDAQSNPGGVWRPDFGYQGEQGVGSYSLVNNNEKQVYTSPYFRGHDGDFAETPFVSNGDGTLSIVARPSANPEIFGYGYTSGLITTQPTFAQTYGYFEMRADIPDAAGAWPAFWLIPQDGSWPPELDVMEVLTSDARATWTTEHSGVGGHSSNGVLSFIPDTASGYHTYGVLWTRAELVWYVDGAEVFRAATPSDMNKPMFMLANLALGGWGGAIDNGQLPAVMTIDYIRAYSVSDTLVAPASPTVAPPVPPTTVTGTGGGLVLVATSPGDPLTGGAGADVLHAGQGPGVFTGGAGADIFRFDAMPWSAGRITDFQVGVDTLDILRLYAVGHQATDPVAQGYVRFVANGSGGTDVYMDVDGPSGPSIIDFKVVTLDGVDPASLTSANVLGADAAAAARLGTPGPDTITGVDFSNYLRGADGDDLMYGAAGFDDMHGNKGADTLHGGLGSDWVVGGQGSDLLLGEDGDDLALGNMGEDTIHGGAGADIVRGGQSDDILYGGAGDDWLSGDRGSDTITGGTGADIFHSFAEAGLDRVLDFSSAEGDRVMLDPGTVYTVAQRGADVYVEMIGGGTLVLQQLSLQSLGSNWIFLG